MEEKEVTLKRHISGKIFDAIETLNYFNNGGDYVIKENVKRMLDTVCICKFIMTKKQVNELMKYINNLMHFDLSFGGKQDKECKNLAAQFLFYLFFTWKEVKVKDYDDRVFNITPFETEEELFERYKIMKTMSKWRPFFEVDEEKLKAKKVLYQMLEEKYGWSKLGEDGKPVDKIVIIKNKKNDNEDGRVKKWKIYVFDGDTREIIKIFERREDVISEYGISKSRLSQCITSCKDPNWQSWNRWKDKNTGKRYYFKEIHDM